MTFRHAHASGRDASAVIRRLRVGLGEGCPSGPGFLYFTDRLAPDAPRLLAELRAATGVNHWIGSVGVGVIGQGVEYGDEPAASVLIADWPQSEYRVFSGRSRPPRLGERTASGAGAAEFAIIHADPGTPDVADLVGDMSTKVSSGFVLGGLSSARGQTCQIADEVLQGGLSGLVVSSAVSVTTRLSQGCQALPDRHVVTAGERNVIATIDGRRALDVFREVAGVTDDADLERAAFVTLVGLPVAATDSVGDYLVRDVVGLDPRSGRIAIGAAVERGMPIIFCRRDAATARLDLDRMLEDLMSGLSGQPRGALYFSCLARGEHMFGERSAEASIIRNRLGEVPFAGFFAAGEISHDRLYGYTGVLALFT